MAMSMPGVVCQGDELDRKDDQLALSRDEFALAFGSNNMLPFVRRIALLPQSRSVAVAVAGLSSRGAFRNNEASFHHLPLHAVRAAL